MRIREGTYKNQSSVAVFITAEESDNDEIKNEISKLKQKYKNVAVFVSGKNDMAETLRRIINSRL